MNLTKDWDFQGLEEPKDAPNGSVWRKGTERYLMNGDKWVMSGCFEKRAELENLFMSDYFEVWDESYNTDNIYEVLLHTGETKRCHGHGGLMWQIGTRTSYSKDEIRGMREITDSN